MENKKIYITVIILSLIFSLVGSVVFDALYHSNFLSDLYNLGFKKIQTQKGSVVENNTSYVPQSSEEAAIISVVQKSTPSVVSIIISKNVPILEQCYKEGGISPFSDDPFFQQFFPDFNFQIPSVCQKGFKKQDIGGGTGFIVSANGLILTNKHVVLDENADYTVLTNDGEKYPAKVLVRDPLQDVALIKIEKNGLVPLILGDSDKVVLGQKVIAIGNALGEFRNTVSSGIVSGLSRTIQASGGEGFSETIDKLIQTDAAINPGNSGGPLLNLQGDVIGINTAMAQGAQSIGFALPINRAKKDIKDYNSMGKVVYPFLGVNYVMLDKQVQKDNNLSVSEGAWVHGSSSKKAVVADSPADKAGIKDGDIILEVDGIQVSSQHTLSELIQSRSVGDTLTLKILRDGKNLEIKVTLEERKI
jgi:serine protease Do